LVTGKYSVSSVVDRASSNILYILGNHPSLLRSSRTGELTLEHGLAEEIRAWPSDGITVYVLVEEIQKIQEIRRKRGKG
jgi:hypothetical protein